MRKIFAFLLIALLASCGSGTKKAAVEYNDAIIAETDILNMGFIEITQAMMEFDYAKAKQRRVAVESSCSQAVINVEKLGPFKDDSAFQQAVLLYIKDLKGLAENEVKSLLNNWEAAGQMRMEYPDGALKLDQENDSIGAIIRQKDSVASVKFITAQKEFAEKYGIKLLENPDQQKIDDLTNKLESQ